MFAVWREFAERKFKAEEADDASPRRRKAETASMRRLNLQNLVH
jgi:hypothetical protein